MVEMPISYKTSEEKVLVTTTTSISINKPDQPKGLGILNTGVFIAGSIAGTGFLTLPKAIDDAGWIGFVLIPVCCCVLAYTGVVLGDCWTIVKDRYPEFQTGQVRYPYPAIGEKAYGKLSRFVVSASINLTMFGGTIVYVLLAAENIVKLLPEQLTISVCFMALIVGGVMTPFTWLGTPKDFWGIALIATIATGAASLILFVSVLVHGVNDDPVQHTDVDFMSLFVAYGVICFAYHGHAAFPTFQSDMKDSSQFGKAIFLGYTIVLLMYSPSSAAAYVVYGEKVQPNILATLPNSPTTVIVSVLMTAHLLFGIVIVINPVMQALEHVVNIPEHFTWKRVMTRTLMMAAVLFVAESVPHFSSILSLVGGSTISVLAFICPPLFYLKLCRSGENVIPVSLHKKILLYEIVLIGVVAGIAATISAVHDLYANKFTVPCYVDTARAFAKTS